MTAQEFMTHPEFTSAPPDVQDVMLKMKGFPPVKREDAPKEDGYFKQTLKNVPESALGVGKSIIEPIMHPMETVKNIGTLGVDMLRKTWPGQMLEKSIGVPTRENSIDTLGQAYKDRYGGLPNIAESFKTDPVGVAMDASTLLTGGGSALSKTGKLAQLRAVEKTGGAIKKTGELVNPVNAALSAAKAPLKLLPEETPIKLYQSAVKMSPSLTREERLKQAETGLKYNIKPTYSGLDRLREISNDFSTKVDDLINQNTGKQIKVLPILDSLDDLSTKFLDSLTPEKYQKAIERVKGQLKSLSTLDPATGEYLLEVKYAQGIKKRIYTELEGTYKRNKTIGSTVTQDAIAIAKKHTAAQIKNAIAAEIPEVAELNKDWSKVLGLEDAIEKAASRLANRDLVGVGVPLSAGVGQMVAGNRWGMLLGIAAKEIVDSPSVKVKIARLIKDVGKRATAGNKVLPLYGVGEASRGGH